MTVIIVLFTIIFFPIFIKISFYFSSCDKKAYFIITIFGIKIFGGYIVYNDLIISIHYSNKNAIVLPVKKILTVKMPKNMYKGFNVIYLNFLLEIYDENYLENVLTVSLIKKHVDVLFNNIKNLSSIKKINDNVNVITYGNKVNFYLTCKINFNIFTVLSAVIKIIRSKNANKQQIRQRN